jgi:hypothetical protein
VPSSVRGLLISLKEALICVGVLSGYSLGYLTAEQARTWRGCSCAYPLSSEAPIVQSA